jgi:hypothetical protein
MMEAVHTSETSVYFWLHCSIFHSILTVWELEILHVWCYWGTSFTLWSKVKRFITSLHTFCRLQFSKNLYPWGDDWIFYLFSAELPTLSTVIHPARNRWLYSLHVPFVYNPYFVLICDEVEVCVMNRNLSMTAIVLQAFHWLISESDEFCTFELHFSFIYMPQSIGVRIN